MTFDRQPEQLVSVPCGSSRCRELLDRLQLTCQASEKLGRAHKQRFGWNRGRWDVVSDHLYVRADETRRFACETCQVSMPRVVGSDDGHILRGDGDGAEPVP